MTRWPAAFVLAVLCVCAFGRVLHAQAAPATPSGGSQWQFNDEGDFRIFTVDLPLQRDGTKGIIKPEGQGWFEMRKK